MWRKLYHININQKKEGIPLLISDRDDLRVRKVIRDNEGCYIIIKWSVYSKKTQQSLVCMCLTPEVHVHTMCMRQKQTELNVNHGLGVTVIVD